MTLDELIPLWDAVDDACDRVACALPAQMTDAADRLERARKEFRRAIMLHGRAVMQREATHDRG